MSEGTLGEFLRSEREQRSITIEQVASATKISVKLLLALEGDQYSDLPAKPFVRGFVLAYLRFLDLDTESVLTRFAKFLDDKNAARGSREKKYSGYAFERSGADRGRTILVSVMAVLIIGAGAVLVVLRPSLRHKQMSSIEQLESSHKKKMENSKQTAEVQPAPEASPNPSPNATPAPGAAALSTPIPQEEDSKDLLNKGDSIEASLVKQKVVLRALADVWVRYKVDDRPIMRILLKEGKILVMRGTQEIRLQVSNPKSVEIRPNNSSQYQLWNNTQYAFKQNGTPTAVFAKELIDKTKEFFPGTVAMPTTSDPTVEPAKKQTTEQP